jgi:TPR repeat protein
MMKQRIKTLFASGAFALTLFGVAAAGPFEDGLAAYKRGDYAAAMNYWFPLAVQGNAYAEFYLGGMYQDGQGVPQDYAQAAAWYRKAAEQGNDFAQFKLGDMYRKGQGEPRDNAQAIIWYRKAAEQANEFAQTALGVMYESVPQKYVQAHMWLNLAAAFGEDATVRKTAVEWRDKVAAKMTPAQIAEAQRMAREWKPTK